MREDLAQAVSRLIEAANALLETAEVLTTHTSLRDVGELDRYTLPDQDDSLSDVNDFLNCHGGEEVVLATDLEELIAIGK